MAITAASTAPGWYGNSLLSVPAVQAAEPILQIYANARALRDRMILNKPGAGTEYVVRQTKRRDLSRLEVTAEKTSLDELPMIFNINMEIIIAEITSGQR